MCSMADTPSVPDDEEPGAVSLEVLLALVAFIAILLILLWATSALVPY